MADSPSLSARQAHALLDTLSHHEVYSEIRDFRYPGSLANYGHPFQTGSSGPSAFPALQTLVTKFLLQLPGLRNVSQKYWQEHVANIIEDFEKSRLSESYDKGYVGIRRTLATAASALLEYPVRGVFSGFDEPEHEDNDREYDLQDAADLQAAFKNFMQRAVYGDLVDILFQKTAETDKIEEQPRLVQAAHEFILVNLASFMHYTLILSPKGQYLLWLIDHANKLVPYTIMKQTLRIGNVASMINAMMRVVLAKMSVTSVTNWIGLTQNADDGMNLLQHIISQTLSWDSRDMKAKAGKIEKQKDAPKHDQLEALRAYLSRSQEEQDTLRETSRAQALSIVNVTLSVSSAPTELTETQHQLALEYLALQLSIRDREQIIKVLCHSHPDHLTQAVRDVVTAYEPVIRSVHNAVDLSETLSDFESFLRDTIKLSKLPPQGSTTRSRTFGRSIKVPEPQPPTVGDFVQLLKKHQYSLHKFLHSIAKNGKEVTSWFHDYVRRSAVHFQRRKDSTFPTPSSAEKTNTPTAGALTADLQRLFSALPAEKQTQLLPILDAVDAYLTQLHASSAKRLQHVLHSSSKSHHPVITPSSSRPGSRTSSPAPRRTGGNSPTTSGSGSGSPALHAADHAQNTPTSSVDPGPGAYLARWQALIDDALVTPAQASGGAVRSGGGTGSAFAPAGHGGGPGAGVEPTQNVLSPVASVDKSNAANRLAGGNGADNNGADDDDEDDGDVWGDAQEHFDELDLDPARVGRQSHGRPDVTPVVDALGKAFRRLLAERAVQWAAHADVDDDSDAVSVD